MHVQRESTGAATLARLKILLCRLTLEMLVKSSVNAFLICTVGQLHERVSKILSQL